jgi:hypothetical protein
MLAGEENNPRAHDGGVVRMTTLYSEKINPGYAASSAGQNARRVPAPSAVLGKGIQIPLVMLRDPSLSSFAIPACHPSRSQLVILRDPSLSSFAIPACHPSPSLLVILREAEDLLLSITAAIPEESWRDFILLTEEQEWPR